MILRCIVACQGGEGPDLYFVKVDCSQEQYDNGEHYDRAIEAAKEADYDEQMVAFDEKDQAGDAMLHLFEWETADTVKVGD